LAREQRRLAAILFADAVGSSRLMGRDESGTVARLLEHLNQRLAPAAARRAGRVVRIKGDGGLVEFASAVDALAAAIDFQQAMVDANRGQPEDKAILFRIGLHLGDVIVEGDDIYGDDVNVASRLEAEAPPGGIVVSRAVREAVEGRLKATLHALGDLTLKNIARPIRAFGVEWSADDWPATQAVSGPATGTSASLQATPAERMSPPRSSIVVLPFANIGGDPEQEYFVDGVTGSLTTDLSRMSGMSVIGRNTAFTYKGRHVDLKHLGHELGARYVLEGSVQRMGNRMRVNAQLIDTENGNQLWAERFDKPVADLFEMQDEIVARLARQLGTQLTTAEARRAERTPNPNSLDLYFQGMTWVAKGSTAEHLSRARSYFERALTIDPGNIQALVLTANVDLVRATSAATIDRAAQLAATEVTLSKVLSMAPDHAFAHACFGWLHIVTNRAVQGIAECERALVLDRNLASAHALIGLAKIGTGRAEETEAHVQEALRLSPRDTFAYTWMSIAGFAKILLGSDDEAVARYRRSIEMNRNHPLTCFHLAAALAHLNRLEEAQYTVQAGLALNPAFTVHRYRVSGLSDNQTYLAQHARVVEGMRKAGVPE
jgi:TolB-like protein/class 3 adenylate cyclase/Flp pilus assembly protein TadD